MCEFYEEPITFFYPSVVCYSAASCL